MAPDERACAVLREFDGCAGCVPPEISVSAIAAAIREATAPLEARIAELEAALRKARGMLDVAMRNDLPGWSDGKRTEMIRANPGIRIIDAALEAKP